jgi:hypothetical protein
MFAIFIDVCVYAQTCSFHGNLFSMLTTKTKPQIKQFFQIKASLNEIA